MRARLAVLLAALFAVTLLGTPTPAYASECHVSVGHLVCGRIHNADSTHSFRITYAWGGNGSTDRELYPHQKSESYHPDADGFRLTKCWRAHLWSWDDLVRSDYGYRYGPSRASASSATWFKVVDKVGPASSNYWEVNGFVRVC